MKGLIPRSFAGQTVLVLLAGLSLSHVLAMTIYSGDRTRTVLRTESLDIAHHIASITRILRETPAEQRARIVRSASDETLRVSLSSRPDFQEEGTPDADEDLFLKALADIAGDGRDGPVMARLLTPHAGAPASGKDEVDHSWYRDLLNVVRGDRTDRELHATIPLGDGQWLIFVARIPEPPSLWFSRTMVSESIMALAVIVLAIWVVRRLTRPAITFARAAERLGRDVNARPLVETGPSELRLAIRAFNKMQQRILRLIENRRLMLAAISHDLRTPITLLRLRAEFIVDPCEQRKTLETLDEMELMIENNLSLARETAGREARQRVDLAALIESICDDIAATGVAVTATTQGAVIYECRPLAMKRVVVNLIENAVKYGGNAEVRIERTSATVEIVVEDTGPGIPDEELSKVFSPYYRIEPSRSRETGGVGLGLSVARTIVNDHGGEILLTNRPTGGLSARIQLP